MNFYSAAVELELGQAGNIPSQRIIATLPMLADTVLNRGLVAYTIYY